MRAIAVRSVLMTLAAGSLLAACSDSPTGPTPNQVASLVILPGEATLTLGDSVDLEVVGFKADNTPTPIGTPTYTSLNTQVARVTAAGKVTTHGEGATKIRVTASGITTTMDIAVVDPGAVASVALSHAALELLPTQTAALAAEARNALGEAIDAGPTTWHSTNPAAATVATDGMVTAVATGTTRITATIGGRSASLDVTVAPNPAPAITRWNLKGIDFGDLDTWIDGQLLHADDLTTVYRATVVTSGVLDWNHAAMTWQSHLVTRTFTLTLSGGSSIVSNIQVQEWHDAGVIHETSPLGTHELESTVVPGKRSLVTSEPDGITLFHELTPAWRKSYLRFKTD